MHLKNEYPTNQNPKSKEISLEKIVEFQDNERS